MNNKKTIGFFIALIYVTKLFGQNNIENDSARKVISLQEVEVCDAHAKNGGDAFSFYQSSKLSSTDDILNRIQGLNLIRRGPYGLEPSLRAFNPSQVNLMIDGMRIQGACSDKMDPASIYVEPVNLSNISSTQGGAGSMMGSNIGGLIQLSLKEPSFMHCKKPMWAFSQSYNTVNQGLTGNFSVNHEINKTAFRISAAYRKAENYIAGGGEKIPFSQYEKYNVNVSVLHAFNQQHQIKADYIGDIGNNTGFPALSMDVKVAKAGIYALTYRFNKHTFYQLFSENKIYYNQIHHEMDDSHRPLILMHMDMPGNSQTFGIYSQNRIIIQQHQLDVRADYTRTQTDASMTMYPKGGAIMYTETLPWNEINILGIAVSDVWKISAINCLTTRFRLDLNQQQILSDFGKKEFEGLNQNADKLYKYMPVSISTQWLHVFTNKLNTHFQLAYAERAPNANERMGYYLYNRFDSYDYIGNLNLAKEKSMQAEWNIQVLMKKTSLQFSTYFNQQLNYIMGSILALYSPVTQDAKAVKQYVNITSAMMYGTDAYFQYLGKRLSYNASVKFAYTADEHGNPLPMTSPLKYFHALRIKPHKWSIQLEHEWAAAQYRNNIISGEKQTEAYQLFHLRCSKNIPIKNKVIQLGIACENIADTRYRDHLDWGNIPRQGRNFQINLSVFIQ